MDKRIQITRNDTERSGKLTPMKRIGLVVGKFSPLHLGHEFILNQANGVVDQLVTISYSVPEFANAHASLRQRWLSALYPQAIHIVLSPLEVYKHCSEFNLPYALNNTDDEVHRELCFQILQKLKIPKITDVFTSESYGDGFAQHLSRRYQEQGYIEHCVAHTLVDLHRKTVNMSGTKIRQAPDLAKDYLSATVSRDTNIKSICLIGAESTGKSTLALALAAALGEPCCQEYGRELWERKTGNLNQQDLLDIGNYQCQREDGYRYKATEYLLCDTSPLTTLLYSESMFSSRPLQLEFQADRQYSHVFLCAPDFPMIQDGTRQGENFRNFQHQWYLKELNHRAIRYTQLFGSWQEKFDFLLSAISATE